MMVLTNLIGNLIAKRVFLQKKIPTQYHNPWPYQLNTYITFIFILDVSNDIKEHISKSITYGLSNYFNNNITKEDGSIVRK